MRVPIHVLLAFVASISGVSARELTLTLGGDEYQGPPKYEVLADDVVVGEGEATAKSGQVVTLDIGTPKTLAIRFTNDLAGPKGADGVRPAGTDRNLIIEKVEIDGTEVPLTELPKLAGLFSVKGTAVLANSLTVPIPLEGLPAVAEATPAPAEAAPAPVAEAAPAPAEPTPAPVCTASEITLVGYSNGVVELPADALTPLTDATLPPECLVTVTGYSSSSGSADLNLSMAEQRANAVRDQLVKQGVAADDIEVVPFGATTQFGPKQADNRRVIVSFRPRT